MQVSHFLIQQSSLKATMQGVCCVCGFECGCLPKSEIMSKSTGSVSVLCPIPSDAICVHCAELWKEPKTYARSVWATLDGVQFPTIAPDPKGDRPTWRDIVGKFDSSQARVAILSTDPKKRVWPYAQVSRGASIALYLHDPSRGISELRTVDGVELMRQLHQIEEWLHSFGKAVIGRSLLTDMQQVKKHGMTYVMQQEAIAEAMRKTPEFIPALIIAQKEG